MMITAANVTAMVQRGERTAQSVIIETLERIRKQDTSANCFTTVLDTSALEAAEALDRRIAAGLPVGPLAGVPFAVKNLFDIAGTVTLAGSTINRGYPPASQDATAIARLKAAGGILVGALNMDEYAYGFVTVNHHYGPTPNPHDKTRISGGSSGGSAAAVAAGLVPLSLGSDTNGSIRVPASLCGVYGLKPTYGRISRAGAFLFSSSLDHIGPFAQSLTDLALAFDLLQGPDDRDPVCCDCPPVEVYPAIAQADDIDDITDIPMAIATGYFSTGMMPVVAQALDRVTAALAIQRTVVLPESDRARAAAYIITASEGSQLHLPRLQTQLQAFDPATRDRFVAGALIPNSWYIQAQRFRRWYQRQVQDILETVDVIVAPTTPCVAPLIDQETMNLDGTVVQIRPHLGLYTQPVSFIGLPVLSVPVYLPGELPIGIQLIARPYNETILFRVASFLDKTGVLRR